MPELSPVPRDAIVDRSGGVRARVTHHAVRRYAERALALGEDMLDGVEDRDAVEVLKGLGVPVAAIRDRLAYYGGVQLHYGAAGVLIDGARLVVVEDRVVTVVDRRAYPFRSVEELEGTA
ncbi:hypothetical protein OKC48_07535 [Methylorubrum extorquens]|uniref:hypothetical protein n=1 Tax=Methylorubrum extorquens TaxID=408 RepID=UPI002237FAFC|nr:hypothetical protein [Methylorubrum extorquens]UYW28358.1 hypothetical protein OKC48_07535 [Methylorubrum extorquens]